MQAGQSTSGHTIQQSTMMEEVTDIEVEDGNERGEKGLGSSGVK